MSAPAAAESRGPLRRAVGFLGDAWLVLVLGLAFGGALAGVQVGLADRVEANRRAEILERIPALVLGETVEGLGVTVRGEDELVLGAGDGQRVLTVTPSERAAHDVWELAAADGERLGWVVRGAGAGYADTIDLLVGLDAAAERLTGLYVLSQKETPALGDNITKEPFRSQFRGVDARARLEAVNAAPAPGDGRIRAITAATISSRSVCDIVNRTLAEVRPALTAGRAPGEAGRETREEAP